MNDHSRRDGYYMHHGMTQGGSPLRHSFSAEAARRLHDRQLSPQEWDMVLQTRIEKLLRPYEDALRNKDAQITSLRAQVDAYQKADQQRLMQEFLDTGKNKPVVLIDGSGSMAAPGSTTPAPIVVSLGAAQQAGIKRAMLWGDSKPSIVDLTQPGTLEKAAKGLHSGTDLAPTLDLFATVEKARKIVIVSDGDVFDADKSKAALLGLLQKHDVSVILVKATYGSFSAPDTRMAKMVSDINGQSAGKKINLVVCSANTAQIQAELNKLTTKPAAKKTQQPKR